MKGPAWRRLSASDGAWVPFLQWRRLQEIATVLWSSGFGWWVDAMGLGVCVSFRCRLVCSAGVRQCPHHVSMEEPLPERLVAILERLGPTFVKVGQLMATRADDLPPHYAAALRALHDDVPGFSGEVAKHIVAAELARPLEAVYTEFDGVPIAAASLSQVHRARLVDGTEVAVKVQRPTAEEQAEADLALLGWIARRLERRRGTSLPFRPTVVLAELIEHTRRELDFRNEARTTETVRRFFATEDLVVVPQVCWEQTTARVLTMQMIHGHRPAPRAELAARGLDADRLLRAGARAMLKQVFELGVFHADPHPGNILLVGGNRVCFLDFGLYGRLDRQQRRRMAMVLYSLVREDYDAVSDQFLHLSERLPGADVRRFRAALAEVVEQWYGQRPAETSVAGLLLRELSIGARFGVVFPRELILLARALVHLEATASVIDPTVGLADLIGPLLPDLQSKLLPTKAELKELWSGAAIDYLTLATELPAGLPHLIDRLLAAGDRPDPLPPSVAPHSKPCAAWFSRAGSALTGAAVAVGVGWWRHARSRRSPAP